MASISMEMRWGSLYKTDREWEGSYQSQVLAILRQLISHLAELSINLASDEKDRTCATDFELNISGGTIAVRLRRPKCTFRDWTVRAHRDNGTKTELAKLKEGHAFRYFYGWTDDNRSIAEWILIDLDKVRASGLLDKERPFKPNGDGTHFISITIRELHDAGCLIAYRLKDRQWERAA